MEIPIRKYCFFPVLSLTWVVSLGLMDASEVNLGVR